MGVMIGPEKDEDGDFLGNGPEFGPDLTDPLVCCEDEEALEDSLGTCGLEWSPLEKSIPYIFPSSPEFLTSPPVYGTARNATVGCRSFSCSGRPDTYNPLLSWCNPVREPISKD
nr:hypothetical protein Itr_chr04CG04070 [Ipomoea trifida]GMC83688.1 hypothetical protein Iba_chr04cCG4460 [Ipomoea batatas]